MFLFAVFVLIAMLGTTKFNIVWPEYFYADLRSILLLVIIMKTCVGENYDIWDLILIFVIGSVFLLNINRSGYEDFELILLLIIGAKNINLKSIVRVYFTVTFVLLIITICSALTGHIENLIYFQEGRRSRMSLGIGYPTDFAAYIFTMQLLIFTYEGEK